MPNAGAPSLLSHLESSFSNFPNPHTLSFTALESIPRRTTSLYPYAISHPRCFQIDYLITLACEVERPHSTTETKDVKTDTKTSQGTSTSAEHGHPSAEVRNDIDDQAKDGAKEMKKVMTAALSAHLYILPHHRTSILYISKVDSSGHPTTPVPLTRTFITSTLTYFLLPKTRPTPNVRIQLFARSQGQYLFPNSSEGPKKILGGLGLCGWWKGVYEDVAASALEVGGGEVKLGMVLPGYSAEEAKGMLGQKRPLREGLKWTSSPPFETPLPIPTNSSSTSSSSSSLGPDSSFGDMNGDTSNSVIVKKSLAVLIPSLPDDPKARFLDDLVSEGAEDPTRRHKLLKAKPDQNVTAGTSSSSSIHSSTTSPGKRKEKDPHKSRIQAENEAERRFTHATLERVSQGEYWERMGFRQECISGDVTGFFTLESSPSIESTSTPMTTSTSSTSDPKPPRSALPHGIVDRILAALLNTDFKTYESAIEHSGLWERSVKTLVIDEVGEEGYGECIAMVEGKVGEVAVPVKRKEEAPVTMLQPRKKKKVQA